MHRLRRVLLIAALVTVPACAEAHGPAAVGGWYPPGWAAPAPWPYHGHRPPPPHWGPPRVWVPPPVIVVPPPRWHGPPPRWHGPPPRWHGPHGGYGRRW